MINEVERAHSEHSVLFYECDDELADGAGRFLAEAVLGGGTALAIATPSHLGPFREQLADGGVDVVAAETQGNLIFRDARATLESFRADAKIDPQAFRKTIGAILREAGRRAGPVHVYGEMVGLLWEAGDVLGAIELEELWNTLAEELPFSLMCGYRRAAVSAPSHREALERVCQLHSSVHHAPRVRPSGGREVSARFLPEPGAPGAARRLLADALNQCGHDSQALQQDASLVMSELVTNAVIHARAPISVSVHFDSEGVRLAVHDRGSGRFKLGDRGSETGLGAGLQIVASLAAEWGVDPAPDGNTVWARLPDTT